MNGKEVADFIKIIDEYDKRADMKNLVGEAKRLGLAAINSKKYKNNYAFFQLVMFSYNIWRYIKLVASMCTGINGSDATCFQGIKSNTIRIARLRLLFMAPKVVKDAVKYSIYCSRTPALLSLYSLLDHLRKKPRPLEMIPV